MFFGLADFLLCLGLRLLKAKKAFLNVQGCSLFEITESKLGVQYLVLRKGQDSVRVVSPGGEGVVQCCGGDWWCGGEGGGGEDVVQCGEPWW